MIEEFEFGKLGGEAVRGFILRNASGLSAKLISNGARLTEFHAPGRDGKMADVVLGFDDLASYAATKTYFGATCGRYGNRIKDGRFRLHGQEIQVDRNEGRNHLHGGREGFDRKIWQADADHGANAVVFRLTSPDGDQGFPGKLELTTTYRLGDDNVLDIRMQAAADAATAINIVHHSYWNLAGHGSGDVLGQDLQLFSDFYTPVDAELITTGEVRAVAGTAFDFREAKPVGQDIGRVPGPGDKGLMAAGYDHNWCINGTGGGLVPCARIVDPQSGRGFELSSNEPGVQVYVGGYLDETIIGKGNTPYCRFAGLTFETQKFPNTPNFAHFPSCSLEPGQAYDHRMIFRFFAA